MSARDASCSDGGREYAFLQAKHNLAVRRRPLSFQLEIREVLFIADDNQEVWVQRQGLAGVLLGHPSAASHEGCPVTSAKSVIFLQIFCVV